METPEPAHAASEEYEIEQFIGAIRGFEDGFESGYTQGLIDGRQAGRVDMTYITIGLVVLWLVTLRLAFG